MHLKTKPKALQAVHKSAKLVQVSFSQENEKMLFANSQSIGSKKQTTQPPSQKTSRTVSAKMLRWSLSRSIKLGIFSRKLFTKEMIKV